MCLFSLLLCSDVILRWLFVDSEEEKEKAHLYFAMYYSMQEKLEKVEERGEGGEGGRNSEIVPTMYGL